MADDHVVAFAQQQAAVELLQAAGYRWIEGRWTAPPLAEVNEDDPMFVRPVQALEAVELLRSYARKPVPVIATAPVAVLHRFVDQYQAMKERQIKCEARLAGALATIDSMRRGHERPT